MTKEEHKALEESANVWKIAFTDKDGDLQEVPGSFLSADHAAKSLPMWQPIFPDAHVVKMPWLESGYTLVDDDEAEG